MKNWNRRTMLAKMIVFLLLLLAPTILLGCGAEEKPTEEGSQGLFYKVVNEDTNLYLFGSVHVGEEAMYPIRDSVMNAFESSDLVAMELDLENINEMELAQQIMQYAMYQDGQTMSSVLSEEVFQAMEEYTKDFGITGEMLDLFKPWYGGMLLTELAIEETRFSQEHGVEQFFLDKMKEMNKTELIGLETIMDQLQPFMLLSEESQNLYLEETLKEIETLEEDLSEMIDRWIKGDFDYFSDLRNEMENEELTESFEAYYRALTDERDESMTESLIELMNSGEYENIFVVVGTLHLVGEHGIPQRLENEGYEVILK